jgi:RNA polymerase sigma-70 factor (ECF subfamily)
VALSDKKTNAVMSAPSIDENWRTCFEQLAPKLLLFARQWVPSRPDAEDVVQNAFVRFWRARPKAGAQDYPLLYAAVRTAALDFVRRNGRRARREANATADPLGPEAMFVASDPGQGEDAEAISSALSRLPEAQREVVVLRIWSELTFQEIGTALGQSINTVAARYRYGLEALRRVLKRPEYERI